ncbi:MAG: sugar kinase [Actinomycetales bacterium]
MSGTGQIDVATLGETMVSFRTDASTTSLAPWRARVAGAESTVAVGLARLGHRSAWVGRVGDDPFGELVIQQLRGQGVDVQSTIDERRPTGLMFVERRTADLARVTYRRADSAGSALDSDDAQRLLSLSARVVHLSGITPALSPSAREAAVFVAETISRESSQDRGLLSFDVNYRSRLWDPTAAGPVLRQLAACADVVIASDDELALLAATGDTARSMGPTEFTQPTGQTEPSKAERDVVDGLLSHRATVVAVKRGARGASIYTRDTRVDAAALTVSAVDELGAGDAFSAGLLSGLLDGLEPAQCLARATALGAFAVSTAGDWEGLPTRAELSLLDRRAPGDVLR